MRERTPAWLVIAMAATSVAGCGREAPLAAARPASAAPPRSREAPAVEQVRDWTNPKRIAPTGRERNPFKFDSEVPREGRSARSRRTSQPTRCQNCRCRFRARIFG